SRKNSMGGQQTFTVRGQVVDERLVPLPGANILEKGTTNGTQTDFDGNFSLEVSTGATLTVSYIGFETRELLADSQSDMQITMVEAVDGLDEVVVIGYGTQIRSRVAGAVDQVNETAFEGRPSANVTLALQGRSPGLVIQQRNSEPGAAVKLNIRGISTFGNNSPLVVIDGIVGRDINVRNPSDIENVSILKDAGSAAIYGSRANNGVV